MTQAAMPLAARDRIIDRYGVQAAAWIDDFGAIVSELCQKWALDPRTVHAGGTGAVVECLSADDGTPRALKLSPDRAITEQEASALTYWTDANTVVDLVDADITRSAKHSKASMTATRLSAGTGLSASAGTHASAIITPGSAGPGVAVCRFQSDRPESP